jgi:GH15 family glucan-1,4-alpha-glucosidase
VDERLWTRFNPKRRRAYPAIADYAVIGDCHTAALVHRHGSIDWCCLPRFDSDSCFGRLLDWRTGGYFEIRPKIACEVHREYVPNSLILVTTFKAGEREARLIDFFAMRRGGRKHPRRELIRILTGVRGRIPFSIRCAPRFDFGEVEPWIEKVDDTTYVAAGSNTGLMVYGQIPLTPDGDHDLRGEIAIDEGHCKRLALQFVPTEELHNSHQKAEAAETLAAHYDETLKWWEDWSSKVVVPETVGIGACMVRSAIVLKALTYAPTGAIIAAPTTSLPETIGGERNWDYRFSWVRDSVFTVHALSDLGLEAEADGFRRFIARSAAGNADDLQVAYGVDGKRRLTEVLLNHVEGWRHSQPVRIGNAAADQYQGDMYGLVLELVWRWSQRGNSPQARYWTFLVELVDTAIAKFEQPDYGIWEIRARPRHFVHSKVMCWAAVNRGIGLAERYDLKAPLRRWKKARDAMREEIERRGVDKRRGIFVQAFGSKEVDAALLLLPTVSFVDYRDARMMRTADKIREELAADGLILRYRSHDGLRGREGVFLPCTFWLVEVLARQGLTAQARKFFNHASACANDLGLFAEEYSVRSRQMLGNFPQGLTHLAHISAALALTPRS